jgi:ubiquinone/menaquinone biosynthesis C-methylase UbiE
MNQTQQGEKHYEIVFGETFALYSQAEFLEFMEPFRVRFERNGLSHDMFKGKTCLDAGCGNGRGSLFMLTGGAAHVTCLDISGKNIETTSRFLTTFGYDNFTARQTSLETIPLADAAVDFVWCNGVIMHTKSPNRCLGELARVLKPGGQAWLYIYGSGGVLGRIVRHMRVLLRHIPTAVCLEALRLMHYDTRYVAEFIDDWYASFLRAYTDKELARRLAALGFDLAAPLKYGMDYDTSHRLHTVDSRDGHALLGEGDLRYLLTKTDRPPLEEYPIPEGEYGSQYDWPEAITSRLDPAFQACADLCSSDMSRIAFCGHLQREVRLLLTEGTAFTMEAIEALFRKLESMLRGLQGIDAPGPNPERPIGQAGD